MKRILLIMAIFMAAATGVSAKGGLTVKERLGAQDTIVVKMANGAKMVLYLKNMEQLQAFQNYSLDSLMRELNKYVKQVDKMDNANQDMKSKEMTVTFNTSKDGEKGAENVTIMVQETGKDGKVTKEKHEVRINKNFKIDVEIEEDGDDTRVDVNTTSDEDTIHHEKPYKATRFNFGVDLGLNNFVNTNDAAFVPDLKPLGSRYISLNSHLVSQIGGKESPFHLVSGLEFSFNNYMFDKNAVIEDIDDQTQFRRVADIDYDKSKLTHSAVNVPLMAMLKFKTKNNKDGFKIGAGAFAGYRLGSHAKLKYEENNRTEKDKIRGSYNLSDFQYGVEGVVGYRGLDLFVKYNMNDLFKDNRGPQANVISFGIRL
ncbi:outer membrane beta-barrel protein [Pontibacter vulgaris]|uniref:outer membrane beta-barrel protein n=1 Tax=Pontibacter vulgaris TaxID=2905679 RepID=UPI001FA6FB0E|nr:outer membrane beta-barrel protein [Pontibacter vulgaris]